MIDISLAAPAISVFTAQTRSAASSTQHDRQSPFTQRRNQSHLPTVPTFWSQVAPAWRCLVSTWSLASSKFPYRS